MQTSFEEIYHLFLNSLQDYSLSNLFQNNITVAQDMLQTFLIRAIPKFYNCVKDIKNVDTENNQFNVELDIEEKMILSEWMVISWMDMQINDITQMSLNLNDLDCLTVPLYSNIYMKSLELLGNPKQDNQQPSYENRRFNDHPFETTVRGKRPEVGDTQFLG